ncbi:MAG TPA: serine/threonine-protein kinase, partial [Polyangiaceae bacterium]|nr:serine/threonine-protein kinase [Polyangiaceae bacterium]
MEAPLRPGDVVDGAYVIQRLLGQGGMGAVFVALEPELDRRVAVKVLLGEGRGGEAAARFEREARAVAALQSDHVARIFRVGCLVSGAPYMAMELLEGEDLAASLARRGPLPSGEVLSLMLQACEGLAEAHERGIVHRDLKPANLFLARRPTGATALKILDFGIAKAATPAPLTATRAFLGTPLYMSPEQINDVRSVDARSDLWALGVVMYELLTGAPPFVAMSVPDVSELILHARPTPPSAARPGVPPALEAIVLRCLEKDPAARYASARELAAALAMTSFSPAPLPDAPSPAALTGVEAMALWPADGPFV